MTKNNKTIITFIILAVLLICAFMLSMYMGAIKLSLKEIFASLLFPNSESYNIAINKLRLPRTVLALFCGAGLAASGAVFQGVLKNPLADPFTLGISGGAAFGAALGVLLKVYTLSVFFVPLFAFGGAALSVLLVYYLSLRAKFNANTMVLSGVITGYVFSAFVLLIFALSSSEQMYGAFMWLMGSLSNTQENLIKITVFIVSIGTIILIMSGGLVNAVSLGHEKAATLGINTKKSVTYLFITASFITAACVASCGVIGFVGLMMAHIMRKFTGSNNKILIPASALAGGVFLPVCDAAARTLFLPLEIPTGVITSIAGGLFFMVLLIKSYDKN
jgi:iron complex transport system permease protein